MYLEKTKHLIICNGREEITDTGFYRLSKKKDTGFCQMFG
jgi:hypothetical protein